MIDVSQEFIKEGQDDKKAGKSAMKKLGEGAFLAMKKMKDQIGDFLDDNNDLPKYLLGRDRYDNESIFPHIRAYLPMPRHLSQYSHIFRPCLAP